MVEAQAEPGAESEGFSAALEPSALPSTASPRIWNRTTASTFDRTALRSVITIIMAY